ncbi:hypothetical protein D3C74_472810 [compost metagenome]
MSYVSLTYTSFLAVFFTRSTAKLWILSTVTSFIAAIRSSNHDIGEYSALLKAQASELPVEFTTGSKSSKRLTLANAYVPVFDIPEK